MPNPGSRLRGGRGLADELHGRNEYRQPATLRVPAGM
jgi:hypothetical protein